MVKIFLVFIFFSLSCVASEMSRIDRECNPFCDCRPLHMTHYNKTPKKAEYDADNCCAITLGLICLPVNIVWRTITFTCGYQDSLFCCDVLCARCAIIGGGSTCCGSSYYPDRFGICAHSSLPLPTYSSYTPPDLSSDPYLPGESPHADLDKQLRSGTALDNWVKNHGGRGGATSDYRAYIPGTHNSPYHLTKEQAILLQNDYNNGKFKYLCQPRLEKK